MVYRMNIYVDGGCRNNGYSNAVAAAAAVMKFPWGGYTYETEEVYGEATNRRAEITAIMLGLQMALDKYEELDLCPSLKLTIYSDSQYAVKCMNEWIYKWHKNGWTNSRGYDVANRDLLEQASHLDDKVAELGRVYYEWIPRCDNDLADKHCNEKLDDLQDDYY